LIHLDCVRYHRYRMAKEEDQPESGEEEDELFTLPVPPPLGPDRDVVFFAQRPGPGRDHEDIMLRRVPRAVAHHFRGAAGARGLTHAQYLAALVGLHEAMRKRADAGDAELEAELERLGLNTVSI
jgi:hypothetical protein